jgi:hypothetical protein
MRPGVPLRSPSVRKDLVMTDFILPMRSPSFPMEGQSWIRRSRWQATPPGIPLRTWIDEIVTSGFATL